MLLAAPERMETIQDIEMRKFEECLQYVLDKGGRLLEKIINHEDMNGLVPLQYSTDFWPQYITKQLLEKGAMTSIGKMRHGQPIINKIKPEVSFFNTRNYPLNGFFLDVLGLDVVNVWTPW